MTGSLPPAATRRPAGARPRRERPRPRPPGRLDPAIVSLVEDPAGGLWAIDAAGQLGHLAVARLCGVAPQYSSTISADHRIAPGDPGDSLVWLRLSRRGAWQMPPVATSIPDAGAVVVREWIEQLDECPQE